MEKETCNTLEGLFEALTNKFRPQYNETIKSLQFRNYIGMMMSMQRSGWGDCV